MLSVVRRLAVPLVILLGGQLLAVPAWSAAAARETTYTALSGPVAAPYGATVRLRGYLRGRTGAPLAGHTVLIQRSPRKQGRWSALTTRRLAAGQTTFTVDVVQTTAYDYRAHFPGTSRYAPSTSPVAYPAVLRKVVLDSIVTTNRFTGGLRAAGRLTPAPANGSPVHLQVYSSATRSWKTIGTGRSSGSSVTVAARVGGSTLRYRLYAPLRFPYGAGVSGARTHQHFVWRGVFRRALLAKGGTARPEFRVVPPSEAPARSEAELLAGRGGTVWGDLNTVGCTRVKAWFGNITDGPVRVSLLRGSTTLGAMVMSRESESEMDRPLGGSTRTRLLVQDRGSAHGPVVATDAHALCNN